MKLKNPMLVVTDIDKSVEFYKKVFGLHVIMDFGANKTLTGGLALQTVETYKEFIGTNEISFGTNNFEIYFEEDNFDKFIDKLKKCDIEYVHPVIEHSWGQRVVRFYDPDKHIIEVGENLKVVCKRFLNSGMTPVCDVLGMKEHHDSYRNKGQIPVGIQKGNVVTGFYRINSNTIIDMDYCMIQSERINEVLKAMKALLVKYKNAEVFRHILIKHAFSSDEVMVVWIVRSFKIPHQEEMITELTQSLPFIKSIVVNLNQRQDNVILGEKEKIVYGTRVIIDKIHDLQFSISSKSFYQVNPVQTEVLYGKALEFAGLTGKETVLDLYCGVGTISMFLAQKAKHVTGIEIVPQAIQDAKKNAELNEIDNIEFVCSDAATFAKSWSEQGKHPDVIVVDPPRKGCDEVTINSMVEMNPDRIVYVSCDPGTLARDLKILEQKGYKAEIIQPVDMFPYTHHVETVNLIVKK